jgi:FKBP-type peptidyl-prolyl cis-trans isomerase FklB
VGEGELIFTDAPPVLTAFIPIRDQSHIFVRANLVFALERWANIKFAHRIILILTQLGISPISRNKIAPERWLIVRKHLNIITVAVQPKDVQKGETMIGKWLAVLGVMLLAAQCTGEPQAPKKVTLETDKDKASYGVGVTVAKNFKQQGVEVDVEVMIKGLKDEFSGAKLLMTEEEIQKTVRDFQAGLKQKQAKAKKMAAVDNKKEGEEFLAENKKKEGVVTLPSGLQYKILKAGEGKKPTDTDMVEVHYRGTLINGTEFDSSHRKGQPVSFKLQGVIPGWREALKLMPAGSKWQIFIPPQLAYGERGSGAVIGPNAMLIFEVELLAIK